MSPVLHRLTLASLALVVPAAVLAQTLHLKAATFDPTVAEPAVPAGLARPALKAGDEGRFLVQLKGQVTPAARQALLSAGATIDDFIPANALIVNATKAEAQRLRALPGVKWVGDFHPFYKVSPELGQLRHRDVQRTFDQARGVIRAVVFVFAGEDATEAVAKAQASGLTVASLDRIGERPVFEATGPIEAVRGLTRLESVQFVDEAIDPETRNTTTQWVIQSNVTDQRPIWDRGLRGQRQIVGIIDGRLDMNHNCFRDLVNNTPGPNHRKVVFYSSSSGIGADSHGTHVSGTVAGDREPVNGQTVNNGNAPLAKIAFTNLSDISNTNLYSRLSAAHNAGARDHGNSWGNDGTRSYTAWAQAIDQFSYDFEDSMVAFAVSNGSIVTTPENAKSALGVGATRQAPSQNSVGSGGTGPTQDGRRKPEVFAPGIGIVSARSGSPDGFTGLSGTSMACPAVTAAAALVRQWYREGRYIEGSPSVSLGINPSGSLIRATLMATSVDMTGVAGYPSNAEGFGRLLLDNGLWFPGETRRTRFRDVRRASGLTLGEARSFSVLVTDGNNPLRIALSFADFAASINASQAWVNDLDLEVRGPDGTLYLGNVFDTAQGQSIPGGAADFRNSTEMVILNAPAPGAYTVTVRARAINQGTRMGYGVVVNGNLFPISSGN